MAHGPLPEALEGSALGGERWIYAFQVGMGPGWCGTSGAETGPPESLYWVWSHLVCFLLCGMISAFLLLPGAEHSRGGWEHAVALGP